MTILDALVLGVVQGITEFLPISSSGHLIIVRDVLGLQVPEGLAVDATLQLATAFAVVWYFKKDLWHLLMGVFDWMRGNIVSKDTKVLILALLFATIPAVVAGLFLESTMDTIFRNSHLVAWVLIAGSVLFIFAEFYSRKIPLEQPLTVQKGILVGLFQVLALVPGMSRSGATISGGMIMGFSRASAARFSFLLSVPIILGSGGRKLIDLGSVGTPVSEWVLIGVAALVAFVSGLAAIHFLLTFLRTHTLLPFVLYRVALATVVFWVL